MRFGIVIPAHNEADYLPATLDSLLKQTYLPHKIIVVDDNSTDNTQEVLNQYVKEFPQVKKLYRSSEEQRLPGAKIVQAFNFGLSELDDVDVICKFDADLIFPEDYLEKLKLYFTENQRLGLCGGVCSVEKNGNWIVENLTNKNHLRGALKSYRKTCFEAIGGLKIAMGWDTIDELLAQYHGFEVKVDTNLIVKHLRETASAYNKQAQYMQGEMFYRLRYGLMLSFLASLKLAHKKRKINLFKDYTIGFFKAMWQKKSFLISKEEGAWVREYRWQYIYRKINILSRK